MNAGGYVCFACVIDRGQVVILRNAPDVLQFDKEVFHILSRLTREKNDNGFVLLLDPSQFAQTRKGKVLWHRHYLNDPTLSRSF